MTFSGKRTLKPRYRTWDVVVVPFPFTDSRATKVRPAVIISTDVLSTENGKYLLAMITSASNPAQYGDVSISDLKIAGLPGPSVIRVSKLAIVEEQDFHKRVGTLPPSNRQEVSKQLAEYIAGLGK